MIKSRLGTMDQNIIEEMEKDPYFVRNHVKEGDVIIDCGANIGAFADYVLSIVPKSEIICIEPMPSNITALRENLKDAAHCNIIHSALMGKKGTVKMYDFGLNASACHSVFDLGKKDAHLVEVPAVTFGEIMDKYNLKKIDFCKLDVQGAEYDIILRTSTEVLEKVHYIVIEMHANVAKDGAVIGSIPDYGQKIAELVRYLSKTHILLRGIPAGNTISLWKNKRSATRPEKFIGQIRMSLVPLRLFKQRIRIKAKQVLNRIAKH